MKTSRVIPVHEIERERNSIVPKILLEPIHTLPYVLVYCFSIALDSAAAEVERRGYVKVMDSYGLMGVLRITRDEHVLVAVTGVLSVGQLYGADIVKIIGCELISLRTIGAVECLDPRIIDESNLESEYDGDSDQQSNAWLLLRKLGPERFLRRNIDEADTIATVVDLSHKERKADVKGMKSAEEG
ncbi:hypothetical protein COOONC_18297 [Cooperia oncophora]